LRVERLKELAKPDQGTSRYFLPIHLRRRQGSSSDLDGRDKCLPGVTYRCHELRRLDRSFRGFKEI
jgi:hypothetical protein